MHSAVPEPLSCAGNAEQRITYRVSPTLVRYHKQ